MRVICPSAKMQTTSPSRIAWLAALSDLIKSRGRDSEEIGMHRMIRAKVPSTFCFMYPAYMMNRIGRSVEACSNNTSMNDK